MPTHKQIQANRSNAQLSTGPRTEPGKAISRLNALRTGIDAIHEAASGIDPAILAAGAVKHDHEWQPIGLVERHLTDFLIKDLVTRPSSIACEARKGAGFAANINTFQRLPRQIMDTDRFHLTHLTEPDRRQEHRRQHQPKVDSAVTDSPETENPGIGFVSQTTPNPAWQHPAAAGGLTNSPKPDHGFGFVPHTTRISPVVNSSKELWRRAPWASSQPVEPSDIIKVKLLHPVPIPCGLFD